MLSSILTGVPCGDPSSTLDDRLTNLTPHQLTFAVPFPAAPGTSAPAMDKYDTLRQEAERAMRRQEHHKQQSTGLPADADADAASPPSPAQSSEAPKDHHGLASHADREDAGTCQPSGTAKQEAEQESKEAPTEGEVEAAQAAAATAKAAAAAAAANAGKRRTDEAGVQSAKERYLARKAQKTG